MTVYNYNPYELKITEKGARAVGKLYEDMGTMYFDMEDQVTYPIFSYLSVKWCNGFHRLMSIAFEQEEFTGWTKNNAEWSRFYSEMEKRFIQQVFDIREVKEINRTNKRSQLSGTTTKLYNGKYRRVLRGHEAAMFWKLIGFEIGWRNENG